MAEITTLVVLCANRGFGRSARSVPPVKPGDAGACGGMRLRRRTTATRAWVTRGGGGGSRVRALHQGPCFGREPVAPGRAGWRRFRGQTRESPCAAQLRVGPEPVAAALG